MTRTITGRESQFLRGKAPGLHYPVVIVGGGINGAGLFRDLSLQGVDCLLIEASDICAGASGGSSRLIHGGIKYLENGEFRLVRQATLERNLLLRNAPHYVKPIETVLPIYSWLGGIVPSIIRILGGRVKLKDRGVLITKLGLEVFDLFGRHHRMLPRHRLRLRASTRRTFPDMIQSVTATAIYYDARVTYAERLGLELLLDGMAENAGSLAINYMALEGRESGTLLLGDRVSGAVHRVTADVVVNAAGAWIDRANAALGLSTRYMGGNKGSHLILDNLSLHDALGGRMVYFGASDGRIALLYPFMGHVLVGSTDIPVTDPDLAVCEDTERDYMLSALREVFPCIPVGPEQVVYTYCGVRPLPCSEDLDSGAVSRDHSIIADRLPGTQVPIYAMIGGKWTTFRGFAEETADRVLSDLGRVRRVSTMAHPIGGGRDFPTTSCAWAEAIGRMTRSGVSAARARLLLDRYGTRAAAVAAWCAARQDVPSRALPDYSREEFTFIFVHELVGRLSDVLFRRTDVALSGRLTAAAAEEVARIGQSALGWDEARVVAELADVSAVASRRHSLTLLASGSQRREPEFT